MPYLPPRVCAYCGRPGCLEHCRVAWAPTKPTLRIRGRKRERLWIKRFQEQPFCMHCKTAVARIRDHIVPLAQGGLDVEANTQMLCVPCHEIKTKFESTRGRSAKV